MLITWDIVTDLEFDINGFLKNPKSNITALLVTKSADLEKESMESTAESMGVLFQLFLQDLYQRMIPLQREPASPIINANFQLVPNYGLGKHSGIIGKWRMSSEISNCS